MIEKLRATTPGCSQYEDDEVGVLCLDNPVNADKFLADFISADLPVQKAAKPGKKAKDRSKPDDKKSSETKKPEAAKKNEEIDEFFGHEEGDQVIEPKKAAAATPAHVESDTTDTETEDDETLGSTELPAGDGAIKDPSEERVRDNLEDSSTPKKQEITPHETASPPEIPAQTSPGGGVQQPTDIPLQPTVPECGPKNLETNIATGESEKTAEIPENQEESDDFTESTTRVEHTVSLPSPEKDSSTEDENSAVKMNSDTESVKSIVKQEVPDNKPSDKAVKFTKSS